jgi:two-component system response regulator NreC
MTGPKQAAGVGDPGKAGQIRIVLADDHLVVRRGLQMLLDGEQDFEVVAEAGDVESARRYVRGHRPTVLVADLNMPGGPILNAIPDLRRESPETQIVVLTMQEDPGFAREALRAGALAYVLKEAAEGELVEAVRRAAAGEIYLNPQVDVLRRIALGLTNREIADELYLSVRTIETHRQHIQQKLRLSSRAELVRYALRQGIFDAD